jgi:hypothetical protein
VKRGTVPLLLVLSALLMACAPLTVQTAIGGQAGEVNDSAPAPAFVEEVSPTPTPRPGLSQPPKTHLVRREHALVGPYAIETWGLPESEALGSPQQMIATISSQGEALVELEDWNITIAPDTGKDLTGEGDPDAVLVTYSGGAHCCFASHLYNLGADVTPVFESRPSNCDGQFQDLNGDGVAEFLTCDDTFAYAFCAFAISPMPGVILSYDAPMGYRPATARYSDRYQEAIARDKERAQATLADQELLELYPEEARCAVLAVVLDYLYTCQPDQAWLELKRLYPYDDVRKFRSQIEELLDSSPLYGCP